MTIEGPVNGAVFRAYVTQVLAPRLRRGDIVVMDNLHAHKVEGIRQAIQATGARLIYLLPYSPGLSPIEPCWAKLKKGTRQALDEAIRKAINKISNRDARGWFKHCGYSLR